MLVDGHRTAGWKVNIWDLAGIRAQSRSRTNVVIEYLP